MKVIKEYLLDRTLLSPQTLYLPAKAEIAMIQDTDKGLKLFALVNTDLVSVSPELRKFKICAIEEPIYADNLKYLGSFNTVTGVNCVVELI